MKTIDGKHEAFGREVGQPYGFNNLPLKEVGFYTYDQEGHELVLPCKGLDQEAITSMDTGRCKLGILTYHDLLLVAWRIGPIWAASAYSYWMVAAEDRALPPAPDGLERSASLRVVGVEATNGIIGVIRQVTLHPTFTRRLHMAIIQQSLSTCPDGDAITMQFGAARAIWRSPRKVLAAASIRTEV